MNSIIQSRKRKRTEGERGRGRRRRRKGWKMGKFEFIGDKRNKHSGSKGSNVMGQSGMERERADVRERKWNCWWKKVEGDSENSRIVLWKNYRICTTIVYYEYGNTME